MAKDKYTTKYVLLESNSFDSILSPLKATQRIKVGHFSFFFIYIYFFYTNSVYISVGICRSNLTQLFLIYLLIYFWL